MSGIVKPAMNIEEAIEDDEVPPGSGGSTPWYGLMVVAVVILGFGTREILAQNAARDEQTRRVQQAQAKMEVLP